ncbi:MAG: crossover junction endodeoxyribonuclease RuvC [Patescibacteria group bacterium]
MTVIAIDPGVERTGFAFFKKTSINTYAYFSSGLIQTTKGTSHEKRLLQIYNALYKLIKKERPTVLVLEQLFFFKNQKTVFSVGQSQGIILLLAAQSDIPAVFLTPLQIKQTVTGYGHADKKSVQKMLTLELGLKDEVSQDDQADAIACGYAYCCINKSLTTS